MDYRAGNDRQPEMRFRGTILYIGFKSPVGRGIDRQAEVDTSPHRSAAQTLGSRKTARSIFRTLRRKFKRLHRSKVKAGQFFKRLAQTQRELLVHWELGMRGVFA